LIVSPPSVELVVGTPGAVIERDIVLRSDLPAADPVAVTRSPAWIAPSPAAFNLPASLRLRIDTQGVTFRRKGTVSLRVSWTPGQADIVDVPLTLTPVTFRLALPILNGP
jgi:hypothetical protein